MSRLAKEEFSFFGCINKLGMNYSPKLNLHFSGKNRILLMNLLVCMLLVVGPVKGNSRLDSLFALSQLDTTPKVKLTHQLTYLNLLVSTHSDSAISELDHLIEGYKNEKYIYAEARCISLKAWFLVIRLQYQESHKLAHKALEMQQKEGNDSIGMALSLNRIGIINLQFERLDEAENYMNQSLEYFEKLGDTSLVEMVLNNLGIVAMEKKDYPKAIAYYQNSLQVRLDRKMWQWVAYSYFNIGSLFLDLQEMDSARFYLLKSENTFLKKTRPKLVPPMVLTGLADFYLANNELDKSIDYAERGLAAAQEKDRSEIILASKETLSKAYFQNKDFEKAYSSLLDYQEDRFRFDSLNNISKVLEVEKKYENAEKEKELVKLRADDLASKNKIQQSRFVALLSAIAAILVIAIATIVQIRRKQKQKNSEAALLTQISDMKLVALRAQMNPHFIFNCINTAQNFVLQSEREQAYDYLSKFAKLLRVVLENSDQSYISLEDELQHLKLYAELEAIRFDDKFEYSIDVEESLNEGVFEIPSMVIQPFVENSIVHGLVNRDKPGGVLSIDLKKEGDVLVCIIEDNGVGREKASEIKSSKKKFYKSTALPNVKRRLEIIQQNTGLNLDLKIEDLMDENGASGTKVFLRLPLM